MDMVTIQGKQASLVKQSALEGVVVSSKMDKTIIVKVPRVFKHAVLGKILRRYKRYAVHDESQQARVGDLVEIVECRPISKTKHMMLTRVVRKAS